LLLLAAAVPSVRIIVSYLQRSEMGEFCLKPCRAGYCYSPGNNFLHAYCTHACANAADCPKGYDCVPSGAEPAFFCRKVADRAAGQRCAAAEECLSNRCIEYVVVDRERGRFRQRYCIDPCAADGRCAEGAVCETIGDERLCSPKTLIEGEAEQRFEMEKRLGIENELLLERRIRRGMRVDADGQRP
jgi:hypothetical protein